MPYTELVAKKIGEQDGKAIWELHEPLEWTNGIMKLKVPALFQCDYASVPRIPIAFMLMGDTAHEAGTVHDYLYREGAVLEDERVTRECTRDEADKIFLIIMGEMGINWFKRQAMYRAVRLGASAHWRKRKVLEPFMEGYKW